MGRTDIEDALKRLDSLIQQEVQMAIAQILKATTEVKDGTRPYEPFTTTLNARPLRCRQCQNSYAEGVERCGGSKVRRWGRQARCRGGKG
jgi:hypothetical protein